MKTTLMLGLRRSQLSEPQKQTLLLKLKHKKISWEDFCLNLQGLHKQDSDVHQFIEDDDNTDVDRSEEKTLSEPVILPYDPSGGNVMNLGRRRHYSLEMKQEIRAYKRANPDLQKMQLVRHFEKKFDIRIPPSSMYDILKVEHVYNVKGFKKCKRVKLQKERSSGYTRTFFSSKMKNEILAYRNAHPDKSKSNMRRHFEKIFGIEILPVTFYSILRRYPYPCVEVKWTGQDVSDEFVVKTGMKDACDNVAINNTNHILCDKTNDTDNVSKLFPCDLCEKSYTKKHALLIHMRNHTGEKPYQCSRCEAAFTVNGMLQQHILTHDKPHTCTICHKSYVQEHSLKYHQMTHTGKRPYHCQLCERAFKTKATLDDHQTRKHKIGAVAIKQKNRLKRFKCQICTKAFESNHSLRKHMHIHLGENVKPL